MSIFVTHGTAETESFAAAFANRLHGGEVIALYGELGVGKTAFVRGLARGLETTSEVSSPTFALVHEYDGRTPIAHFDMYRIHTLDDLYSTGFYDYLDSGVVMVIEWSENVEPYLPDRAYRIRISRGMTENERTLTIEDEDSCR